MVIPDIVNLLLPVFLKHAFLNIQIDTFVTAFQIRRQRLLLLRCIHLSPLIKKRATNKKSLKIDKIYYSYTHISVSNDRDLFFFIFSEIHFFI